MPEVEKTVRQFGLWESPLSPASLAEDRRLDSVVYDGDSRCLAWLEGRSGKGVVVVRAAAGEAPRDLTAELDVRAEVGYGGGDFTVHGGAAYFVVHKKGQIFRRPLAGGRAVPITPPFGKAAAPTVSPDGRHVVYVHSDDRDVDRIAAVDGKGRQWPQMLHVGHDFYMQPAFSPDGKKLAFVAWDHPLMPWDGALLYVADVRTSDDGGLRLAEPRVLAGGPEIAVFQPEFTRDGKSLLYVSDETGWGRVWLHPLAGGQRRALTPDGEEYATPAWVQGVRTYAVCGDHLAAVRSQGGMHRVARIALADGSSAPIEGLAEYSDVSSIAASPDGERIAVVAAAPHLPPRVVEHELRSGGTRIVARASGENVPAAALARCEPISFPTAGGQTAHGLFYAPASERFTAEGKPPLVVTVHGGPTSQSRAGWRAETQFLATRGYAVLALNYRGSTGYGRPYMLALRNNWGVCDVEDAVAAVRHLSAVGRIDPARTVIMGGSAGGFTVLQCMVDHPQAFAAGVCLYGVADQLQLAAQTHKFEARYLDSLLGPLPEAADVYRARSPVLHADKIRRPLAVFQGSIDRVVPREQSDVIVAALKRNNVPHEYHVYEGEGHGWRKRETIDHFYSALDAFLRRYVVFA
jgi:dipeptidyl aminopeptidase/acylaminoacyl peptidase